MADSKLLVGQSRFPFYAVGAGLRPDVYRTWRECYANTHGVKGNRFKGFYNLTQARAYVRSHYKVLHRSSRGGKCAKSKCRGRGMHINRPWSAVQTTNGLLLAAQIEYMILQDKFLPSALHYTMVNCLRVTKQQTHALIHAIGDGIEGNWLTLRVLCSTFIPPVVDSLMRGLFRLGENEEARFRQDVYFDEVYGNIDEETFVCGGRGRGEFANGPSGTHPPSDLGQG